MFFLLSGSSSIHLKYCVASPPSFLSLSVHFYSVRQPFRIPHVPSNQPIRFDPVSLHAGQTKSTSFQDIKSCSRMLCDSSFLRSLPATGSCSFTLNRLSFLAQLLHSPVICQDGETAHSADSRSWRYYKVSKSFRIFPVCSFVIYLINSTIYLIIFLNFKAKSFNLSPSICM